MSETIRDLNLKTKKDIEDLLKSLNENEKLNESEVIQIFRAIYNQKILINYGIVRQILSNANDFDYKKIFTNEVGMTLTADHYLLLIGKIKFSMLRYFFNKTLQNFLPEFIINYFPSLNSKEHYMTEIDEKILSTMLDAFNIPVNLKVMHDGISIGKTSLSIILNSFTPNFISKITPHILLNYKQYKDNEKNNFIDSDTANQLCKDNAFFSSTQPIDWVDKMLNAFQDNSIPFTIFINFFNSSFSNNIDAKEGILTKLITKTAQGFVNTDENFSQLKSSLNNKTLDINFFVELISKFQDNSLNGNFFDNLKLKFTGKFKSNDDIEKILNKFVVEKSIVLTKLIGSTSQANSNDTIIIQMTNYSNSILIEENPSSEQNQIQEQNLTQQYNFDSIINQEAFMNYVSNHQGKISAEESKNLYNCVITKFVDTHINWTNDTAQKFFEKFDLGSIDCDFAQKLFQNSFTEASNKLTLKIISSSIKPKTINSATANTILTSIFSKGHSYIMNNDILLSFFNIFGEKCYPITNTDQKNFDTIFKNGFDGMITRNTLNTLLFTLPDNSIDYYTTKIKIFQNNNKTMTFAQFISNKLYTQDKIDEEILLLMANSASDNTLNLYENFIPETLSFPTFSALLSKMIYRKDNFNIIKKMLSKVITNTEKDDAIRTLGNLKNQLEADKQQLINNNQQLTDSNQFLQQQIEHNYEIARQDVLKFKTKNEEKSKKAKKGIFKSIFSIAGGLLLATLGALSIILSISAILSAASLSIACFAIPIGSYILYKSRKKIKKCKSNITRSNEILESPENIIDNENDPTVFRTYLSICHLRSLLENSRQQPQQIEKKQQLL